ncbi:MAG TPA: hypothetical protein VI485_30880 [Vicinamibacterales bacterium]|nr:hypothetical protein [Vicinamibacterales bacterium]
MKGEVAMARWSTMRGCLLAAAVWVMWQHALPVLSANGQGAAAIPKIVQAAPAKDSESPLLKRIEELERRVKELEDAEIADVKDERSDDAQTAKIEARLASLEKAARPEAAAAKGGTPLTAGTSGVPVVVRAPFVVQGAGGRPIFRVDEVDGRVRAILGTSEGSRAVMGVNAEGVASVLLYDASNGLRAGMTGFQDRPSLMATSKGGGIVAMGMDTAGQPSILVGTKAANVVTIRATPGGFGELSIANNTGQNVVEAGTTKDGLGVVRAGPSYSCAAGSLTLPCQIIGRRLK